MNKEGLISLKNYRRKKNIGFRLDVARKVLASENINPVERGVVVSSDLYIEDDISEHIDKMLHRPSRVGSHVVYILSIYQNDKMTEYVKIGVTCNIEQRILTLSSSWNRYDMRLEVLALSRPIANAVAIEQSIHSILEEKGLKYTPEFMVEGFDEVFVYQDWILNLLPIESDLS